MFVLKTFVFILLVWIHEYVGYEGAIIVNEIVSFLNYYHWLIFIY